MTRVGNQTNSTDPAAVNSRIFVGNLNTFLVGKEEVERIFKRYGRIIGISMHKGYAFVQFTDMYDARNAVFGEDGRTLAGQVLDVNMVSEPKPHQIVRKRQSGSRGDNFYGLRQMTPPIKRPRQDITSTASTYSTPMRLKAGSTAANTKSASGTGKSFAKLLQYSSQDILICGNCKEVFPGVHKLVEHKKQKCKLRFTCRCAESPADEAGSVAPVCATCEDKCRSWWDLVCHVQKEHGVKIFAFDESKNSQNTSGEGDSGLIKNAEDDRESNGVGDKTNTNAGSDDDEPGSCSVDGSTGCDEGGGVDSEWNNANDMTDGENGNDNSGEPFYAEEHKNAWSNFRATAPEGVEKGVDTSDLNEMTAAATATETSAAGTAETQG